MYRLGELKSLNENFREDLVNWGKGLLKRERREKYETFWALRDIDLDIERGDTVGIIGRNGAGKSTMLKILSRITQPTTGELRYRGRLASLLEVGTGFHRELTGRENIYLNGAILGMTRPEIDRAFDAIVDFAGVEKFLDTPVKRYSSGMYVRLAFAVAAHLRTDILVVDEVLAVGDAEFQKKCLGKMQDVATDGRTVIFVSHNMGAVGRLCSRCVYLQAGSMVNVGETEEIIRDYMRGETLGNVCDLSDLPREKPPKGAMITSFKITNTSGDQVDALEMGGGFQAIIGVRLLKDVVERPHFGMEIRDSMGIRITRLATKDVMQSAPSMAQDGEVCIHVPTQNLMPGVYYITLGISEDQNQLDFIEDVVQIEVLPQVTGSEHALLKQAPVKVFLNSEWRFEYTRSVQC